MIRNTALIVPREGNIEFQNVPKASVFCLGDSFLPFLPPSFPLPIPLPALTTAVQRQCLGVQGRTRAYTVQRVRVQSVTGRRGGTPYGRAGGGKRKEEEEEGRRKERERTRSKGSKGSRKRTSLFCLVHFRGAPMHTSH